jgi:hypothetical protein
MKLNPYSRTQTGLVCSDLFPTITPGVCVCGCGQALTGRKLRWASKECAAKALELFWIVKGVSRVIRNALAKRDNGICAHCGEQKPWDADHIVPVHMGGGGCDLDNFQTLCDDCHKAKSAREANYRRALK